MRTLRSLCFLLILMVVLYSCGNSKKNSPNPSEDIYSKSGADNQKTNLILDALKEGENHITDSVFGKTINLIGKRLNLKDKIDPNQMLIKDNYLIIDNWGKDSIFKIFKLPDLKCISSFGIQYFGPEGFVSPKLVESFEDSILFYIYENTDDKVYKVSKNNLSAVYYLTLPKQSFSLSDKQIAFYDNNSAYYVASTESDKNIYYFNKDSLPQGKVIKDLTLPGIKTSWTTVIGDFGMNKRFGRMVFAYKYYKRLKIIDFQTMRERNIIFNSPKLADGLDDIATLEPTNITHFWGMSPRDKYFWMLYSGRKPTDVIRDNSLNKKYIFVEQYDWNGNPIKRYKLDNWGYFSVDENNSKIYLVSTDKPHSLIMYNLNDTIID
jgi:hypothetical protein